MALLDRGVNYSFLMLNPDSEIMEIYSRLRVEEDLKMRALESLSRLKAFAHEARDKKGKFSVFLYSNLPYFACLSIDRKGLEGLMMFSPYMPHDNVVKIQRADSPHYLFTKSHGTELFEQISNCIDALFEDSIEVKLI